MNYYDRKETRSADERANDYNKAFPELVKLATTRTKGYSGLYKEIDLREIKSTEDLNQLPVLRKAELQNYQSANLPFGGFTTLKTSEMDYIFQSPGPIYEPGSVKPNWWRIARFLHACGLGKNDMAQTHPCLLYTSPSPRDS